MITKQVGRLKEMQEEISDICDEIHNILNKDFNLLCNMLVRYEPSFDEAKLNITLVYFNRHIAEYIYDLNSNRFGARKADFNPIDTNGEKFYPASIFKAFESSMKNKLDADCFIIAENYGKDF